MASTDVPNEPQDDPESSNSTDDVDEYDEIAMEIDQIRRRFGELVSQPVVQSSSRSGPRGDIRHQARSNRDGRHARMHPVADNVTEKHRRDAMRGQSAEMHTEPFTFMPFGPPQQHTVTAAPSHPVRQGGPGLATPVYSGLERHRSAAINTQRAPDALRTQAQPTRSMFTSGFHFLQPDETSPAKNLRSQPDGATARPASNATTRSGRGSQSSNPRHTAHPVPAVNDVRSDTRSARQPPNVETGSGSANTNASKVPKPEASPGVDGVVPANASLRQQLRHSSSTSPRPPSSNTSPRPPSLEEVTPRAPTRKLPSPMVSQEATPRAPNRKLPSPQVSQVSTTPRAPARKLSPMHSSEYPQMPGAHSGGGMRMTPPLSRSAYSHSPGTEQGRGVIVHDSEGRSSSASGARTDQGGGSPGETDVHHGRETDPEKRPTSPEVTQLANIAEDSGDEEGWTPVTTHSRRRSSGSQSGSSSSSSSSDRSSKGDERPRWLRYYPPTRHNPGAKTSRYAHSLGNVYIHAMEGERFTPASASAELVTGPVRAKPRPCFLTWYDAGPKDVIYLAPLLGAIPPQNWKTVSPTGEVANDNLHVLERPTWRDRWCSVKWAPDARQVVHDGEMVDIIAPPAPEHPNTRPFLRPQITVDWYDSPQEHPLKSCFIWAGDPGEAIDLGELDDAAENAKVAPFEQYCHLPMSELQKLHDWWKYMYAADPAAVAPAAE